MAVTQYPKPFIDEALAAIGPPKWFDTVSDLLDDEDTGYTELATVPPDKITEPVVATGSFIQTRKEGFIYRVAASNASDHDIETDGGLKLYIDGINVKQFGTKANALVNDATAIQKAIDYVERKDLSSLYFPFEQKETYRVDTKCNMLRGDILLYGNAANTNYPEDVGHIYTTVEDGVIFDYGAGQVSPSAAFTARGLAFYSEGASENHTGVLFSSNFNGPHRAVVFRDCSFKGFEQAIHWDTPSTILAPGFVNIQDCNFRNGNYALLADNWVLGLRFVANQSEQGARLKGEFIAWIDVENSLIEGQSNALNFYGTGSCVCKINNVYIEANTGDYICNFGPYTNVPPTKLIIGNHYNFTGSRKDNYIVSSCSVVNESERSSRELLTLKDLAVLYPNSRGINSGYKMVATVGNERCASMLQASQFVGNYAPADVRAGGGGSVTVLAPHGVVTNASEFTDTSFSGYTNLTKTITIGDICVVSYLIRATTNTRPAGAPSTVFIQCLNQSFSGFRDIAVSGMWDADGDFTAWRLVTFSFVAQSDITTLRARIRPYAALTSTPVPAIQVAGCSIRTFTPSNDRPLIEPMYPVL